VGQFQAASFCGAGVLARSGYLRSSLSSVFTRKNVGVDADAAGREAHATIPGHRTASELTHYADKSTLLPQCYSREVSHPRS
jgi:hypothetical protein